MATAVASGSVLLRLSESREAALRGTGGRAELLGLNAFLRATGAPSPHFGAVAGVPVGLSLDRRTELAIAGLHRHFLSDVCHTLLGVESLIVPSHSSGAGSNSTGTAPASGCDDFGERLLLGSSACLRALDANRAAHRPVRVVRAVQAAGPADGRSAGAAPLHSFRYDGLYIALRRTSQAAELLGPCTEQGYLLVRSPDQPPLPQPQLAVDDSTDATDDTTGETGGAPHASSHLGLRLEPHQPLTRLPPGLEAVVGDMRSVSVGEALARLVAARETLVASMTPHERLAVGRLREEDNRRKRSAVEMLHAPDDPLRGGLPPVELAVWPRRRI